MAAWMFVIDLDMKTLLLFFLLLLSSSHTENFTTASIWLMNFWEIVSGLWSMVVGRLTIVVKQLLLKALACTAVGKVFLFPKNSAHFIYDIYWNIYIELWPNTLKYPSIFFVAHQIHSFYYTLLKLMGCASQFCTLCELMYGKWWKDSSVKD